MGRVCSGRTISRVPDRRRARPQAMSDDAPFPPLQPMVETRLNRAAARAWRPNGEQSVSGRVWPQISGFRRSVMDPSAAPVSRFQVIRAAHRFGWGQDTVTNEVAPDPNPTNASPWANCENSSRTVRVGIWGFQVHGLGVASTARTPSLHCGRRAENRTTRGRVIHFRGPLQLRRALNLTSPRLPKAGANRSNTRANTGSRYVASRIGSSLQMAHS